MDNSSSYGMFDRSKGYQTFEVLEQELNINLRLSGDHLSSPVGDSLLASLKKGGSVLVASDGQVTHGASLGDVALRAQELNATINVIELEPLKPDYAVLIDGPSKINSGVETEFTVKVVGTPVREHDVILLIDGVEKKHKVRDEFVVTKKFADGYHTLEAELAVENDYFKENNVFYKSVKVIDKPTITFTSTDTSPLPTLLKDVYVVESGSPVQSLEKSYAVVLNDLPAAQLDSDVEKLKKFVSDGNGLVVFGGLNSFDRGGYKESSFEQLLPVQIAGAEKQGGGSSIVLVIDISQSFAVNPVEMEDKEYNGGGIDVSKALAINILEGLKHEDFVGVIAFDTAAYTVSDLEPLFNKDFAQLKNKIASLKPALAGETMPTAILNAVEMLKKGHGGRNIIFISDGHIQKKDALMAAASEAASKGITIYTIGVGEQTHEPNMQQVAEIGGGSYFKATQKNKLKILFGGEDLSPQDDYSVVLKERNHFITEHLDINAKVYGFNQATPKPSAQFLVTTDQGDPLLVVWRYGLGRVVTILTDDGDLFAPELLEKKNSKLLVRAISWAVGDPERKSSSFITINDARVGEQVEVTYKGDQPPQGTISFTRTEEDVHTGYLEAKEPGFHTYWEATYAINSPREFDYVGFNPALRDLAAATRGKTFFGYQTPEMVKAVREQSKSEILERWHYEWPFVLLALFIFIVEICLRRIRMFKS
jgi:Mg-chelatase subunit ChlD